LQDIFIQSKVIDIFPKLKMAAGRLPPSWIFSLCEFGHSGFVWMGHGLSGGAAWIAGQDRSMWRTLRPSAGQAQQ